MALSVIIRNVPRGIDNEFEFHIGEKRRDIISFEEVTLVQADGDELDYIATYFTNIPLAWRHNPQGERHHTKVLKNIQVWHGDFAKFIYYNFNWSK